MLNTNNTIASALHSPHHGGDLDRAKALYGALNHQGIDDWLDLSTGISPQSWPAPDVPSSIWARLPEQSLYQQCQQAFIDFYQPGQLHAAHQVAVVAGSQAAIQLLPRYFRQLREQQQCSGQESGPLKVWMLEGCYGEHSHHWQAQGHQLEFLSAQQIRQAFADDCRTLPQVLLLVNPDNPSATQFSSEELLAWQQQLQQHNAWLIVDEAFDSQHNAERNNPLVNRIVLRSIGKFFGMAGLRLGACFAPADISQWLEQQAGPWPVSAPALWLGQRMLADLDWRHAQQQRLERWRQSLLVTCQHLPVSGSTHLFITLESAHKGQVERWQQQLAAQHIWSRCFPLQQKLRLGLATEEDQARVFAALQQLKAMDLHI